MRSQSDPTSLWSGRVHRGPGALQRGDDRPKRTSRVRQRGTLPKTSDPLLCREEGLLSGVLGVGGMAQQPERGTKNDTLVPLDGDARPGEVSPLPAPHEHLVGNDLRGR